MPEVINVNTNTDATVAPEPTQQEPVATEPSKEAESQQTTPEPDLVTKVSGFKADPKPEDQISTDDIKFDFKDLDKVQTPEEARAYAEKAYKSLQSGFNSKFQQLAELRKSLEAQTEWSSDRVRNLLNDPKFVQAAQEVAGVSQQTDGIDDYSALTEAEKKQLQAMQSQVQSLANQNSQLLKEQQDKANTAKYNNYNPTAVDVLTQDLLSGKANATREHIWKVIDYDDAVKRAYEMGRNDRQSNLKENMNAVSPEGRTMASGTGLSREQNESNKNFLKRIMIKNMETLSRRTQPK